MEKVCHVCLFSLLFLSLSELLHSLHLLLQQHRQLNVQVSYIFNFWKTPKRTTWSLAEMWLLRKGKAGNRICAYVLSFHQMMISASCEDKTDTGQINELKGCRVNVLSYKVISVPKCMHTHSPTIFHIHPQPCGQLWPVPCHTSPLLLTCKKNTTEIRYFGTRSYYKKTSIFNRPK